MLTLNILLVFMYFFISILMVKVEFMPIENKINNNSGYSFVSSQWLQEPQQYINQLIPDNDYVSPYITNLCIYGYYEEGNFGRITGISNDIEYVDNFDDLKAFFNGDDSVVKKW